MKEFKAARSLWLPFFILTLLVSGCSLRFSLSPSERASSGIYHTVRKGETLWRISRAYGSSVSTIKDANNLKSDDIAVGQRLLIPHAKEAKKIPPAAQTTRTGQASKPPVIIRPVSKTAAGTPVFTWPLSGTILSTTEEAEREKRVILEGKPGETLTTARAGEVFFVGQTKGYSSTIIVDHRDGFYSVYGGDIVITAHKGDKLIENAIMGKMSSTREKPKLFFEIRRGSEPVNPFVYLKK